MGGPVTKHLPQRPHRRIILKRVSVDVTENAEDDVMLTIEHPDNLVTRMEFTSGSRTRIHIVKKGTPDDPETR